jgi:hypothetical protein
VVAPLPPPLAVVLPLLAVLPRRSRRRPRRRVSFSLASAGRKVSDAFELLTAAAEKEESDDDMGFGLFD